MIQDKNIASGTIGIDKLAFPSIVSGKHTDGSMPLVLWVAKGGADGGNVGLSKQGSRDEPYLTITGANGALNRTIDGRGDRIILGPGIWRENVDIGSVARQNKRDIGLYGSGGAHPGRTQIVSDGATTGPTIRVRDGFLRGFILADLEVGNVDSADADRAQPLVDLETNDTAILTANSRDEYATLQNVRLASDTTATMGLILTGTQMLRVSHLVVAGIIRGIVFRGSDSNFPDHCYFDDTAFFDNVTYDVGTISAPAQGTYTPITDGIANLTNIKFLRSQYMDRGGTPVTNFVRVVGTVVNCGDYEFVAARDVADATLMQLPVDWIAIGRSAAAAEFIIGA